MGILIFIRHGETQTNVSGLLHKKNDPDTLTKKGREQIEKTARYISKYNPKIIFSSKEKRAQESASILSKKLNIPCFSFSGFEERDWGKLSGKSWEEIKQIAGLDNMNFSQRYNYLPPKGESWKNFEERLIESLDKILLQENDCVTVVTHGGVIRALIPYLLKVGKEESYKYDPPNASISIFEYKKKIIKPIKVCDISHLE